MKFEEKFFEKIEEKEHFYDVTFLQLIKNANQGRVTIS